MTTTKLLKDTKDAAKDVAKDAAKDTHLDAVTTMSVPMTTTEMQQPKIIFAQKMNCNFWERRKVTSPTTLLPDLSKVKRNKYPIYSKFEKKKIDCYLDCLPKGVTCEPSFWDTLYPGGEKAEYLEEGKLDGLVSILFNS
nr:hypothetical protein [Tanacetum cinerariifolium]